MFRDVTLPLWLLILIVGFAAVTALDRVLKPSVRWFFRRRMERAVAELNKRLAKPIEPFRLARRHDTIQRLLYDPAVIEAVAERAAEAGVPREVAFQEAETYAREIVPRFSATAYFSIGTRLARFLSRTLYTVRLAHFDAEAISKIDRDASVVFVMNHRSNMDYVLVTYMAAGRTALSYAVGEWARVWPLSGLIRSMGAYFIRRKSRGALYRRVLARYVQIATHEGVTQAVFPEGGLSLDGRIAEPKLGLLNYIITGWQADPRRDVVFVPVALNYDRVLEDRTLIAAGAAGERLFRYSFGRTFLRVLAQSWQWLRGRFKRFGYASVSFGAPVALSEFKSGAKATLTERVAKRLTERVRALVPVLPVPLLAALIDGAPGGRQRDDLARAYAALAVELRQTKVPVQGISEDAGASFAAALEGLVARRLLREGPDGKIVIEPGGERLISYYAASIEQHVGKLIRRSIDSVLP